MKKIFKWLEFWFLAIFSRFSARLETRFVRKYSHIDTSDTDVSEELNW